MPGYGLIFAGTIICAVTGTLGSKPYGDIVRRQPGKIGRHDRACCRDYGQACIRSQRRDRRGHFWSGQGHRTGAHHLAVRRSRAADPPSRPWQDQARRHHVHRPFHVLSTQNPIEQEGTYPLPEAQLDRFLMEIDVDYPSIEAERRIVFDTTGTEEIKPKPVMTAEDLIAAQRLVRRLPVGESVVAAILALVRSARPGPGAGEAGKLIAWGPSPRASQALMLTVRARALLDGRLAPSADVVIALAEPVLKHRMALTFAARADGETIPGVVGRLKSRIG